MWQRYNKERGSTERREVTNMKLLMILALTVVLLSVAHSRNRSCDETVICGVNLSPVCVRDSRGKLMHFTNRCMMEGASCQFDEDYQEVDVNKCDGLPFS